MKKNYLNLQEIHAALLELLIAFDNICREHGLCYSLAYGTLLGAVRHKGFIPWDDDVDVVMPRGDYEKFHELAASGRLGGHLLLGEDRGSKPYYTFMKLLDDRYRVSCETHKEVPYLWIDIFPLDGIPEKPEERMALFKREHRAMQIVWIDKYYTVSGPWRHLLRILQAPVFLFAKCVGNARTVNKLNALAKSYAFDEYELCGVHNSGKSEQFFARADFDRMCELEFEGHRMLAIGDWDVWLTRCYGDYMTPPPENERVLKHNMVCWRNEQ